MDNEVYSKLNNSINIKFDIGTKLLNADGSNEEGIIEKLSPYLYNNLETRLFQLSRSVPALTFDEVTVGGPDAKMKAGNPLRVPSAGESTVTFNKLQLLDFT